MSHAINGCPDLLSSPVIAVPQRQVLVPKFQNLLKHSISRKGDSQLWREEVMMMKVIKTITEKQLGVIHSENAEIIQGKFEKLKRKMRKSADDMTNYNAINNFFKVDNAAPGEGLSKCLANQRYEKIDLGKKYQTKISNNLVTIGEAFAVEKNKQEYRNWLNMNKNNSLKSPNFQRMSFVLQRVKKSPESCVKSRAYKKNHFKNVNRHSSHGIILRERQSSLYIPKSKSRESNCPKKVKMLG